MLSLCFSALSFAAEKSGVTSGTGIQLRKEAVNGDIIRTLNPGIRLVITGEANGRDGMKWYRVSSNSLSINGYIRSDFLRSGRAASEISPGSRFKTAFDSVKIKKMPGDQEETLCVLPFETECTVESASYEGKSGFYWFLVSFDPVDSVSSGYVRYDCLNMDDFENDLENQGFSGSYKELLAAIHELYPMWTFKSYDPAPGYSFDHCVDQQTKVSVMSAGQRNGAASLTGFESFKGEMIPADVETTLNFYGAGEASISDTEGEAELSDTWVAASRQKVAYYMDPRNFMMNSDGTLNKSFLMFLSGTDTEGSSEAGVRSILSGTSMTGNIPGENGTYSSLVFNSSVSKSINPYLVAARMRQEHGGASGDALINGTYSGYEGYYNYFNIGANGSDPVVNGLKRAKEEGWSTRTRSINGGIDHLSDEYFYSSLHKQDTLYKQRFFFKDGAAYHAYMTSIYAPSSEAKNVYKGYENDASAVSVGVFQIPVYKDMPEKPAPLD
ncbi:MAG: hypothetical protein IJU87_00885 [Lachnospiraceae bacterium]|nr:hypothetical protein [Lachnospiraceae bacterium]